MPPDAGWSGWIISGSGKRGLAECAVAITLGLGGRIEMGARCRPGFVFPMVTTIATLLWRFLLSLVSAALYLYTL